MFLLWEYLVIATAIVGIFPAYILLKLYVKTHILDYFLVGFTLSFLIALTILLFMSKLGLSPNINSLLSKGAYIGFVFTSFFIFIYAAHIRWDKISRWFLTIFLLSFIILCTLIVISPAMSQSNSSQTLVGILTADQGYNYFYPDGFLLNFNGIAIIGSNYAYLTMIYAFITQSIKLSVYVSVHINPNEKRLSRVRLYWVGGAILFWISLFFLLPWFLNPLLAHAFMFVFFLILLYLSLFHPDYILISHFQIVRALNLYHRIEENPSLMEDRSVIRLKTYLDNLRIEFKTDIKKFPNIKDSIK